MTYIYSILGLSGLAALAWVVWAIKDWEKSKYKAKEAETNLEAMRDAKDIKNRVDNDPAYRDSVRSRYR